MRTGRVDELGREIIVCWFCGRRLTEQEAVGASCPHCHAVGVVEGKEALCGPNRHARRSATSTKAMRRARKAELAHARKVAKDQPKPEAGNA